MNRSLSQHLNCLKPRHLFPAFLLFVLGLCLPRNASALNVIFILADDAGYGDFGAYGQKVIKTPNIDRMAEQGVRFTRHYAAAPVCAPSRSGLLTGTHTGHTSIRGNIEYIPEGQKPLPAEAHTVAEMLSEHGIRTAAFGKWGLGGPGSEGHPNKQGFDEWYGYLCQRQAHSYYPNHLWENDNRLRLDGKTWTHDLFTHRALEFISDAADDPFFLYLPYTVPHAAMEIPEYGIYADLDLPDPAKAYAAMISRLDSDVGLILEKIEKEGIAGETLVLISSDNGSHAEGGANPEFFDSSGGLRGMKRDLYEGGIRVPLIAYWPRTIPPGTESDHPSAFWDFKATVAELYGLPEPEGDGISYLPSLLGRTGEQNVHDYLYWEFHEQGGKQAVLSGDWKAVRRWVRFFPKRTPELYNLADDPAESRNVAADYPEVASRMAAQMEKAHSPSRSFPLRGRHPFSFQLFNIWLYMLPMPLVSGLFLLLFRLTRRSSPIRIPMTTIGWANAAATGLMAAMTPFLHLQFGTPFDPVGLAVTIFGLAAYSTGLGLEIRKTSTDESLGRWRRLLRESGSMTFWLGLGIAASSRFYMLLWALTLVLRILRRPERA